MRINDVEASLRQELPQNLRSCSLAHGIERMLAFYRSVRAEGVDVEGDGDLLLFQWGTYDWGHGPAFEVDVTRQFMVFEKNKENPVLLQLNLTFRFSPSEETRAFSNGNRWCHSPSQLPAFQEWIFSTPAMGLAEAPKDVILRYGKV